MAAPIPGCTLASLRDVDPARHSVGACVHVGRVHPHEEWLVGILLPRDEVYGPICDVVVNRYHPCLGQRPGVPAHLLADLAEARIDRRVIPV